MSKGFVFLAQNNEKVNYVRQAYLLACSIKATQKVFKETCLITNEVVPEEYKEVFDYIIDIPGEDDAKDSVWKIENRWKIYTCTPFEENIVLDTDMLVLEDITHWWNYFKSYDLFFTTNVKTFRNEKIKEGMWHYRKAFLRYFLPNIYVGVHYFKKCNITKQFYKCLKHINNNWQMIYAEHIGGNSFQKFVSIDVSAALAIQMLGLKNQVTNNFIKDVNFTHMKTFHQGFSNVRDSWQDYVNVYIDEDLNLKIGNYKQSTIFHYVEDSFVTDEIIKKYERYLSADKL